jgi:steroid delta-isomerase-like uncharacterized protein
MSVEENKANVTRVGEEVFNKGNLAVLDELISPNYVHVAFGQEIKGSEGLKGLITMMRTAFPDFRTTMDAMVAEGDMVAIRFTLRGTFKGEFMGMAPTGKQFTITEAVFHRLEDGKQVEVWTYTDMLTWYQQLGIPIPSQ